MRVSPTDFVMVRFASQPYHSMRVGHIGIIRWLDLSEIEYTVYKQRVYFQLPNEMKRYEVITPELCDDLKPYVREVKKRLSAISWSVMGNYRQPLTHEELRLLAHAEIPIIL